MNRIKHTYLTPVLLTALTVLGSCSRTEEPAPSTPRTDALALNIQYTSFDIEQTKTETVTADSLFAYPFNAETQAPVTPIKNDSRTDGVYYFTMPSDAIDIFFTTASTYSPGLKVRSAMPDTLLTIETEPGCSAGEDILYGGITEYAGAPEESIAMTHAVARMRAVLKLIVGEDTVTNLTGYFDTVSVAVAGVASGIAFGSDFSSTYLEASNTISATMNITGTSCHSDYVYTFPTTSSAPTLELRTVISGSGEATFRTPLPSPLEAGSDYTVTIYLHKDNTDAGFTMGDITFNEDFIEENFSDNDFGLVTFSRSTLLFPVEERASEDLVVNSRLGTWRASISTDVLSAYSVENLSTGETASGISPSLTGSSGDTVRFTTLRDLTGSSTSIMEVTFKAEDVNSYPITLMQSNGIEQKISFHKSSSGYYGPFIMSGYCTLYRIEDGGDSTEIFSVTSAERYGHYESMPSGDYVVTGDIILAIETELISDITFENCSTLQDLSINHSSMQTLDLRNLPALMDFKMYDNSDLTALDFSGCPGLTTISLEDVTAITSLSSGESGLPLLTDVDIDNCSALTDLTLPHCTGLKSIITWNSSDITNVDLTGCSSLESISSDDMSLASISLSGCSSLKEFDVCLRNSTITSMDFSESPLLSSLYIRSYSNSNTLRYINIDGCNNLADLYLYELDKLKELDASKASVTEALIYYSDSLAVLNFTNNAALNTLNVGDAYNITSVNLSGCKALKELPYVWSSSLTELNLSKSGIETLDIDMNNTPNLGDIRVDSSALKTFKYYNGSSNYSAINSDTLDFSGCTALDSIYIDASYRVHVASTIVLDGCPAVNSLRISNLSGFSDLHADETTHVNRFYMEGCDIAQLNISNMNIGHAYIGTTGNTNSSLTRIFAENTSLETLSVGRTNNSHSNLSVISTTGSSSLRELIINRCEQLYLLETDGCENLENLRIYNNTSSILPSLDLSGFPNLTKLYLKTLPNITRLDLRHLSRLQSLLLYDMQNIQTLNCDGLANLSSLTLSTSAPNDSLILNNCSSLTSLSLNGGNDRDVKILETSGMTGLSDLSITNTGISGDISFSFPALEKFFFSYNNNVTKITFAEDSKLRHITLENNSNIDLSASDFYSEQTLSFMRLYDNSSSLDNSSQSLDFSGYSVLDTLSIRNNYEVDSINVSNCPSLKVLNLDQCHNMTGLDITGCNSLLKVDLYDCSLSVEAISEFFLQLPGKEITDEALYRITGNPGESADESVAREKNWIPTTNDIASDI